MSRGRRAALALMAVLTLLLGSVLLAPRANALDIPFTSCDSVSVLLCDAGRDALGPKPPLVERPDEGMSGFFLQAPATPPAGTEYPFDPQSGMSIYDASGLAGFGADVYDALGDAGEDDGGAGLVNAAGNVGQSGFANTLTNIGLGVTGLTATIGDFVYDPSWLGDTLAGFATEVSDRLQVSIWVPFLALGLLAAALVIAWRHVPSGNLSASWSAVLSAIVVVTVGVLLAWQPLAPAQKLQEATSIVASTLGNTAPGQPSSGIAVLAPAAANAEATGDIVTAVHYNGWLRRQLGTSSAACATTYGPALFRAQRMTWAQLASPDAATIAANKGEVYKAVASKMKAEHPSCYAALQGRNDRVAPAILELGTSLAANAFRIAAFFLMIAGMVALVLLAVFTLALLPYLVTPQAHEMRWNLIGSAMRAFGYSVLGVITSWAYNAYVMVVTTPGGPQWLAEVLMLVGTVLFWMFLAPHRKLAALMPGNAIDGASRFGKWGVGKLVDHWSRGWVADAATEELKRHDVGAGQDPRSHQTYASQALPAEPSLPAGTPLAAPTVVHEGVVLDRDTTGPSPLGRPDARVIPGEVVDADEYRRMDETATPGVRPAIDAAPSTQIEPYTRKVDQ